MEGKPVDSRLNENVKDQPAFPGQTRAPYHKTAPYKLTEITAGLHAPWALAFLPDGKFLVTEKLPGTLRVVSPDGNIAPPVSGIDGLAAGWKETGMFDLVLDPKFASNHRIYFTFFGFDRGMISGIQVARATFNQAVQFAQRRQGDLQGPARRRPNDNRSGVGSRSGGRMVMGKDGYLYITIGDRDTGGSYPWHGGADPGHPSGQDPAHHHRTASLRPAIPLPARRAPIPRSGRSARRSQEGLSFGQ